MGLKQTVVFTKKECCLLVVRLLFLFHVIFLLSLSLSPLLFLGGFFTTVAFLTLSTTAVNFPSHYHRTLT